MNNEQIVNSIKAICQEHDITITKLEEVLGMSQGLISRWNKSEPSLSKIIDIADYFKISLDEVTGYRNIIDDKFIEKLLLQTTNGILKWYIYNKEHNIPKQYFESLDNYTFYSQEDYENYINTHTELSYYTHINNGYISIYSCYDFNNVKTPLDIKLFIQPDDNASLILQDYTKEQLRPLWLKILYKLNKFAPDEIKAEELKNAFVSENNNINIESPQIKNIDSVLKDTSLIKIMKTEIFNTPEFQKLQQTISSPEFQKLQQTISSPEFQKTIQVANKLQQNLTTISLPLYQKED